MEVEIANQSGGGVVSLRLVLSLRLHHSARGYGVGEARHLRTDFEHKEI